MARESSRVAPRWKRRAAGANPRIGRQNAARSATISVTRGHFEVELHPSEGLVTLRPPSGLALPSSSGLGRGPLKAETRVRFPLGAPFTLAEFVFAFMDCEFGGLDPELHDITEVALILTDYRLAESVTHEWKVRARPDRITAEAAAIQHYDAAVWETESLPLRQVLTELSALLP